MTATRILPADDHDLVRDTIEEFLTRLDKDLHVLHATTLPRVLDLLCKADALDLVLLDPRMPGMNGLAALKSVQAALSRPAADAARRRP